MRTSIPKKTREAVLGEYNHRCGICGSDRPQVHHIDEDASNNEPENLLPLCPNCHLRDQHNPTHRMEIPKLQMFRRHKDPAILKPQFHPIYQRQKFLAGVAVNEEPVDALERQSAELVEFVSSLEMGSFYGKRISELIGKLNRPFIMSLGAGYDPKYEQQKRAARRDYRTKLVSNRDAVQELLVELLRYQSWANA